MLWSGMVGAQDFGLLDSLSGALTGPENQGKATATVYSLDLNLLIEKYLSQGIVYDTKYHSLEGFWQNRRDQGQREVWRDSRYQFLSQPAQTRTGEGLIPDISVPLPGLDRVLGAGAQVKINGNQKISIGGEQTVYPNSKSTSDLERARSNFDLKIKQEQRINLEGVIGDRIHVLIDHDSQAEIDKKSKVRLRYEGKEDEIIEKLEAGDTEFSIQGSSLVGGLSTVHKGLFGVKGVARLGGLELSAIASKDEGQSQSESYTGQSQRDSFVLYDYEYIKHRFFRLHLAPGDSIIDLRVYINDQTQSSQAIFAQILDYSWRDFGYHPSRVDTLYGGPIRIMPKEEVQDFILDSRTSGIFYTKYSLDRSQILAVAAKIVNRGQVRYYPDSTAFYPDLYATPNLAVIKGSNPQPPNDRNGYSWLYEERRFYDLRKPQIIASSLKVRIYKETGSNVVLERDTVIPGRPTFLHQLGLDADDNGEVDPEFLRLGDQGFFYFPYAQPFAMSSLISDTNAVIYNKVELEPSDSKYRLAITYLTATAIFNLRAPGRIIDGSVRVYLDGRLLSEGDYQIDYDNGLVTFSPAVSDQVNRPGAQLKIDYKYYPIFSLGSKTLAGIRGLYKFNESSHLGATWMYRSERSLETKPRLGEEPRRIIVAAMDGSFQARPEILTRLADALPGVETEAASNLSFSGEVAANFPNPNTQGRVYLDDMEGAKVSDEFSLLRSSWVRSSVPVGKQADQLAARFYWYNPRLYVTMGELNPGLTDENEKSQRVTTLKMHLVPDSAAGVNSWAGITTVLSKTGLDFSERKLLNIWVRAGQGRLHLDIGKNIHEDQARRNAAGVLVGPDGLVNGEPLSPEGEQRTTDANDVGIDGVKGADGFSVNGDDGNDDFNRDDSTRMNGTEGNGQYDTEDLLLTGRQIGQPYTVVQNNYHTFSFDLSGSGWQKLTVVLDSARQVGNISPNDWNNLVYARLWIEGLSAPGDVEVALIEVSGNRWLSQGVQTADTATNPVSGRERFDVSVKNNRDDADYSQNPPYIPEKDEQGRLRFEQSLIYRITSLDSGHVVSARRSQRDGERNFTGYRTLKLYVRNHGRSVRGSFLVRLIANDSNSYYQYQEPLTPYWRDVAIELDRFSDLKKLPRDAGGFLSRGHYSIKGNPNLTQVSRIALGVMAEEDIGPEDGVEVWFDDLRLEDVRRDGGTALTSKLSLGLADVISLNLSYDHRGAYFYSINDRPPTMGSRSQSYSFGGTVALHKFYLERAGLTLPVNYNYSANNSYPEFGREDMRLTKEESRAQASRSRNLSFGANLSKRLTRYWLSNLTLDRLSPNISWSRRTAEDINTADSNTTLNLGLGYQWSPSQRRELKLHRWLRLSYLPSSLSWSWSSSQSRIWRYDKLTQVTTTTGSGATRSAQAQIGWQPVEPLSYSFSTQRNLMQKRMAGPWAQRLGLGSEVGRSQRVDYHTTVKWLPLVQPAVAYNVQYNEAHQMFGGEGGRDSMDVLATSNNNSLTASANLPLGKWLTWVLSWRNPARDTAAEAGSPRWAAMHLDKFFKRWNGIELSFSQNKGNQSSGLLKRPGVVYQLGWQREVKNVERYRQAGADQSNLSNNYSGNTQASLGRLTLDLAWRLTTDWRSSGSTVNNGRSLTWPDVRATIANLEKFILWRRAMSSSNIQLNYDRTVDSTWQGDRFLRQGLKKRWGVTWNGRWKNQLNSDLSGDYTLEDTREPNQSYVGGVYRRVTTSRKIATSLSYAISPSKGVVLNFGKLGKKRFKFSNTLSLSLSADYTWRQEKSNAYRSTELVPSRQSQELSLRPNASYNFNNSITGNLSMEYSFLKDKLVSSNNWNRFSLNASVNIQF